MDQDAGVQIVMVSGACCMAHLAKVDRVLEKTLQQAINELGVAVEVRKVSLSALLAGGGELPAPQRQQVLALFQRYGATFTPALMINGQVRFAGVPPTLEQLKDAMQVTPSPQP